MFLKRPTRICWGCFALLKGSENVPTLRCYCFKWNWKPVCLIWLLIQVNLTYTVFNVLLWSKVFCFVFLNLSVVCSIAILIDIACFNLIFLWSHPASLNEVGFYFLLFLSLLLLVVFGRTDTAGGAETNVFLIPVLDFCLKHSFESNNYRI